MTARDTLLSSLSEGIGSPLGSEVRGALGLEAATEDITVARALVERTSADDIARLCLSRSSGPGPLRESHVPMPVATSDPSFLSRLPVKAAHEGDQAIDAMEDVTTLLAILRAGSLGQRRASALRLAALLQSGVAGEERTLVEETIDLIRDVEVTLEITSCKAKIPGRLAREAEHTRREIASLVSNLTPKLLAYWDGELSEEPLSKVSGDARTQLLLYSRELPQLLVSHVAAIIEGDAGHVDRSQRRMLLAGVRYAGDPRYLPALTTLLEGEDTELCIEAARAISRIDDPRVFPALLSAYERSVVDTDRISLGGALGRIGDVRAAEYVRSQLLSQDEHVLLRALEALRTLGSDEDVATVLPLLDHKDALIVRKAIHTMGRVGDARVMPDLVRIAQSGSTGAIRAAAEDAIEQVRARLVLRGEEPPSNTQLSRINDETRLDINHAVTAPFTVRLRAHRHYLVGLVYQLLGATARALDRFEAAATSRPGWAAPLVVAAMMHASRDEYAQALGLFRRALEADRARVERNPLTVRALARCFLRRSEQVERDGRLAIARGLLDEVMALDLRHVPSSLRFEIGRRHEALRVLRVG